MSEDDFRMIKRSTKLADWALGITITFTIILLIDMAYAYYTI